jgi:hypothetical protein
LISETSSAYTEPFVVPTSVMKRVGLALNWQRMIDPISERNVGMLFEVISILHVEVIVGFVPAVTDIKL